MFYYIRTIWELKYTRCFYFSWLYIIINQVKITLINISLRHEIFNRNGFFQKRFISMFTVDPSLRIKVKLMEWVSDLVIFQNSLTGCRTESLVIYFYNYIFSEFLFVLNIYNSSYYFNFYYYHNHYTFEVSGFNERMPKENCS